MALMMSCDASMLVLLLPLQHDRLGYHGPALVKYITLALHIGYITFASYMVCTLQLGVQAYENWCLFLDPL